METIAELSFAVSLVGASGRRPVLQTCSPAAVFFFAPAAVPRCGHMHQGLWTCGVSRRFGLGGGERLASVIVFVSSVLGLDYSGAASAWEIVSSTKLVLN